MGIGDWGLGIGDWGLGPISNSQSPIPNPQSPIPNPHINLNIKNKILYKFYNIFSIKNIKYYFILKIF